MAGYRESDAPFMSDLKAAVVRGPRFGTSLLLFAIIGVLAAGVWWTDRARVPLVTNGEGQVIPSTQVQIVQDLEGGIVESIMVREGDIVKVGQVLLRKNDVQIEGKLREDYGNYLDLLARSERLRGEVSGRRPKFSQEVIENAPELAKRESQLYKARSAELNASISVLQRQIEQRRQELVELDTRIAQLKRSLELAREELGIIKPLVEQGVTSRVELIRLQRSVNDIRGTLETAQQSIPRAQSALREAERRKDERRLVARSKAQAEFNEVSVRAAALKESLASMRDRAQRTDIRSPVDGIVKVLNINTVGGVIRPGMDLIEIVPLEDTLLVEARVRPSDIGFVRPGMPAKVKITAFDYTDYGSMDAEVVDISPDTIVDEKGESFYQILVRTEKNYLGTEEKPLNIKPGMIAQVDIISGDRSILEYLLKPILRANQKALREP
jgi:adhesin transport system membrane fusion protein